MQIIIPMAGLGERFLREGYTDPKPLIQVSGKPIIEHILTLFPGEHDFVFICNEKHLAETNLQNILQGLKPNGKILKIAQHKLGPVHSLLQVKNEIKNDAQTLICYCDIFVDWDFEHFQNAMKEKNHDAALVCFKGFHPPLTRQGYYAGVKENSDGLAEEVREKYSFSENKMDSFNSAGIYYFKTGQLMKEYLEKVLENQLHTNNEYYISSAHNLMIQDGLQNGIYPVEYFISWGNPQDLREYEYWSKHFSTKL